MRININFNEFNGMIMNGWLNLLNLKFLINRKRTRHLYSMVTNFFIHGRLCATWGFSYRISRTENNTWNSCVICITCYDDDERSKLLSAAPKLRKMDEFNDVISNRKKAVGNATQSMTPDSLCCVHFKALKKPPPGEIFRCPFQKFSDSRNMLQCVRVLHPLGLRNIFVKSVQLEFSFLCVGLSQSELSCRL